MNIKLPDEQGVLWAYSLVGQPIARRLWAKIPAASAVGRPCRRRPVHARRIPRVPPSSTGKRRWPFAVISLGLGLGIAEAMDTAQRGMGLDWAGALDSSASANP